MRSVDSAHPTIYISHQECLKTTVQGKHRLMSEWSYGITTGRKCPSKKNKPKCQRNLLKSSHSCLPVLSLSLVPRRVRAPRAPHAGCGGAFLGLYLVNPITFFTAPILMPSLAPNSAISKS